MAILGDFLGELVSSISEARVKSDIQSLKIAQEYAKDNLLQHFSVPRMRVDNVEFSIPIAIDKKLSSVPSSIKPIDANQVAVDTIDLLTKFMDIPEEYIKNVRALVSKHADTLSKKIAANKPEGALEKFCQDVSVALSEMKELALMKKRSFKKTNAKELQALLQTFFKDLIKPIVKPESGAGLEVIVEAAKLKEMRPENLVTIRMRVSEQGMEWINTEGQNGETVSRLLPE